VMHMRTAQKIALARMGYKTIRLGRSLIGKTGPARVKRSGFRWELDLSEVIEFCVFLFGAFEGKTIKLYRRVVKEGFTVIDVGGNIGSHALPLAARVGPTGRVLSLEPSSSAFRKLQLNVALNPEIAQRITLIQTLVVAPGTKAVDAEVYSSWPFESTAALHEKHRGQLTSTEGATALTLDEIVKAQGLTRVDLIKIDVEGHEYRVLQGAVETIKKFKPMIVIELAPSFYQTNPEEFDGIFTVLENFKPSMSDVNTGAPLAFDAQAMRAEIPDGSSRNVLLRF